MRNGTRRTGRVLAVGLAAVAVGCLTSITGGGSTSPVGPLGADRVSARAPDPSLCGSNSAFCGAVLRVESSTGVIGSVAAGAHYGRAWGIPAKANDATGIGWCVDDTHTGFPAGPIGERPLPSQWSRDDRRVAAAIISLYGGDRVLPYQPLPIDGSGELATSPVDGATPTRLRHVAVWLALRSVLVDPAGIPRIDLATASTFSDRGGRTPSPVGNAAIPLAVAMVDTARRVAAQGGDPVVTIAVGAADLRVEPGSTVFLPVRVTDPTGRAIPHTPVWPGEVANVAVTGHPSDDRASLTANRNAVLAGWPSFDTTRTRSNGVVTDMNGVALFSVRVQAAGAWSASFVTETAPTGLALWGDDIRAQNNVALRGGTSTSAGATVAGDATLRYVRVRKTSTDTSFSVAGATFALIDADGTEVARATTAADGIVDFTIGRGHREPLRVREVAAPPGLRLRSGDVAVTLPGAAVSTDRRRPTTVTVVNTPVEYEVTIQKRVVGPPDGSTDLSGFTFQFRRHTASTADPTPIGTNVVTGPDGRTPIMRLPAGDYDVIEISRPAWWPTGDPLPAPAVVSIPLGQVDDDEPMVVTVDNVFPAPPTSTTTTTVASTVPHEPPPTSVAPPTTPPPPTTAPPESTT
ncbi:MAG: SpaA isopeptide-forming pilin-related protein, partial [Ilumatobacter sp.]